MLTHAIPPDDAGVDLINARIEQAAAAQRDAARAEARQWAALAELIRLARAHPQVYLRPEACSQRDALEIAEDAAAFDAGLRLRMSANQVRTLAHRAIQLEERMPLLHAAFTAGAASATHVGAALDQLAGWDDADAVDAFDRELAEVAPSLTASAFRARARRLKQRLTAEDAAVRHARAHEDRRVWIDAAEDGMAFLHLYGDAADIVRIAQRLNATARADQKGTKKSDAGWRTRDQHRADLAVAWLAGDGTPSAATVRPVLLVPMLSLLGESDEPFELRGYGSVDRVTAAKLLAKAPSFRRVGTDPMTGEKLVYDRTRYRPTQAQRDWIAMRFETCIDPTCARPVADADVDHLEEWARDHGSTNDENLFALCEVGNRRKNLTRFRYERADDGRVRITTPTGHMVETDPPF